MSDIPAHSGVQTADAGTIQAWKEALADKGSRVEFAGSILGFGVILYVLARFLDYVEARRGVVIYDPILALFPAQDVTWITFGLIYLALAIGVVYLASHPRQLLLALQSYSVLVVFRMLSMFSVPLDPAVTMIPLKDPLVQAFAGGEPLTRDLFFSGHTSTMFLLYLTARQPWLKSIFLLCTVLVAACVLVQHVHYTVDVIAAPFFCYASYRIALLMHRQHRP